MDRKPVRLRMALTFVVLSLLVSAAANAVTMYGVTSANNLIVFDSATPGTIVSTPITGLVGGDSILAIDFRPATGQLYGLGSGSRLYVISTTTGAATQVGSDGAFTLSGTSFGFDFNPTVDRIRVSSDADQDLRLNPTNGTLAGTDTALAYAVGDPNFGLNPDATGAAYTNNFAGTATTTLFDIDTAQNVLVRQGGVNGGAPSANGGQLFTIGALGIDPVSGSVGFDIDSTSGDIAYAALSTDNTTSSLYTINLATGAATLVGAIGGPPVLVRALAIPPTERIQFSASSYLVNEAAGTASITVTRTPAGSGTVSATITAAGGSALSGTDYTPPPPTVTFGPGVTFQIVTIPITNDAFVEGPETVNLTLSAPTGGAIVGTPGTATLTIDDDEAPLAQAYAIQGGNLIRFSTGDPATILSSVPVTGLVGGDSVIAIDIRPATGELFALGSGSRLYVINPVTGAATQVGSDGAFTLSGTAFGFDFNPTVDRIRVTSDSEQNLRLNPTNGTIAGTDTALAYAAADPNVGQNPDTTGAGYTNNFPGATITTLYAIDTARNTLVTEGGPGGTPSPNGGQLFTVGSLGVDPTGPNTAFDIAPGSNLAFAALSTNGSTSSLYSIDLSTGAATLIGPIGTGTPVIGLAIISNGTLVFSSPTYTVTENGVTATITINRLGGSDGTVTGTVTTSDGTAAAPGDYTATTAIATFGPGVTTATVSIPIVDDGTFEPSETVNLTLGTPTGGATIGTPNTAVLTITDNDTGTDLSITKTAPGTALTGQNATFTIAVQNAGPGPATGVTVSDAIPAGTTFVSAIPTQGTCTFTTSLTCNVGSLANGATATITLTLTMPASAGPVSNTATVTGVETDPDPTNNSSTGTVTVSSAAGVPALSWPMLMLLAAALTLFGAITLRR